MHHNTASNHAVLSKKLHQVVVVGIIYFSTGVRQNVVAEVPDVAASSIQFFTTVRATIWIVMIADVRRVSVFVDMNGVVSWQQSPELYGDKCGGVGGSLGKKDGAADN
jgi:hypothetical protein